VASILEKSWDDSKFNMWRAIFSAIFLDQNVTAEELAWVRSRMESLPFSSDQKQTIEKDINSNPDMHHLFSVIEDKRDRAFVLSQLRVIAHLDGHFSEVEKSAFKKIESLVLKELDLGNLENEISEMEKSSYHEDEVYKVENKDSIFEHMINSFLKFVNPGEHKDPKG
jgi:hypothetical protein